MTNCLFAYGTLRPEFSNPFSKLLQDHCIFLGIGATKGNLYDLGNYPGLVIDEAMGSVVQGGIYRIESNVSEILEALDEYEGAEYRRIHQQCTLDNQLIDCWVYEYTGLVSPSQIIRQADYLEYLKYKELSP